MASLVVLMTVIVAGMNIINYNTVIREADDKLTALSVNGGMLPFMQNDSFGGMQDDSDWAGPQPRSGISDDAFDDDDWDAWIDVDDYDDIDASTREGLMGYGRGKPFSSRDEAEETRFFSVLLNAEESVVRANTDRIYAVDDSAAAEYAKEALKSGGESGWVDEYRYAVTDEETMTRITFLDCSTSLAQFRQFLRTSIIMSLVGLLIMFGVICYFAGRIVKPVAESYDKQKRFITDAGHEIKTPLAIIKANVDLMDMEIDSGAESTGGESITYDMANSLRENLGDIDDQITRLTGLTNDLVYLSRMEEADNSIVMTDVPLSDIVSESVESFESLAWEKGKAIAGDIAPDVTVKGSTKELEKLMSILLENAIKYSIPPRVIDCGEDEDGMPVPPEIKVVLRREGRNAVLEVRNETESELTNEMLSHVFERFYRTDSSRNSATGGHGIGLSMANAIVNAHGGKITAHTDTGRDFIVTAALPLQ